MNIIQEDKYNISPAGLGEKAPEFTAQSTAGKFSLSDYKGKWVVLFSYPYDFSPVCATELISFAENAHKFTEKDAFLVGLSTCSNQSNIAFLIDILKITGIETAFPVVSDVALDISKAYGMIAPCISKTAAMRTVFFIDPSGVIRAKLFYPITNGRNVGELIRLLDALQETDKNNVLTPASWKPGCPGAYHPPDTYKEASKRLKNAKVCLDWHLCYTDNKCTLAKD